MAQADSFLHTTHRTVSWFNKAFDEEELVLAAPFQRNPVWTDAQKAYLIDTILHGYPIPELYMHDVGNEDGTEKHVVVDGQQRIRAVLDFLHGEVTLNGDDISRQWKGLSFEELAPEEKKTIFSYKFVVRVLPEMEEESVRKIFSRLNRNVVALNEQELRNATYWGAFIKAIQQIADEDAFWADSGVFSANDHRRMLDHEFISELAIAYLHGPQNKKDRLDQYYRSYEETFESREDMISTFRKVTDEIEKLLPNIKTTRWRKKSDFYTLFLLIAEQKLELPFASDVRENISRKLVDFGQSVDSVLKLEETDWSEQDDKVATYARNVARAASDRASRVARTEALKKHIFPVTEPVEPPASADSE